MQQSQLRAFRLERWSLYVQLYMQLAVAVIAAVISFQALRDAGLRMGNVAHALDKMDPDFPRILAGLFGSAPPIIVAYGIHVYGRAMTSGVSRHVPRRRPGQDPVRAHAPGGA